MAELGCSHVLDAERFCVYCGLQLCEHQLLGPECTECLGGAMQKALAEFLADYCCGTPERKRVIASKLDRSMSSW